MRHDEEDIDYFEVPEIEVLDDKPVDYDEYVVSMLKELDETIPFNFEETLKKKKEEENTIKELEEIDITEQLKEATDKGILSKISGIKQDWMNVFNDRSYFNELPGEIIFHVLFGQLMKNKSFFKGNKPINLKCHFFWCQESGCLEENEYIHTKYGFKQLKDLPDYFKVYTYNFTENTYEYKDAIKIDSGKKELYEIELEDGRKVIASEDHTFFKENGEEVKLKDLTINDKLLCKNKYYNLSERNNWRYI